MPITDVHPEFENMASRWQTCRDVAGGSHSVKLAGTRYLPRPEGMDPFGQSYPAYLSRALFFNAFARTVDGLAGSIFQKATTVVVNRHLEAGLLDISLSDESLDGFALRVTREVLTVGRVAVLVEMSRNEKGQSPYFVAYPAESVVSWRTERRGGNSVLVRAVLREVIEVPDVEDESKITAVEQFREVALSEDDEYQVRMWVKLPRAHLRDSFKESWIASEWIVPRRLGKPLPFIPLTIIGASKLGATVERPPLIDLADVNLSHYRSSAEREQALYYVSQPVIWVAGAKGDGMLRVGSSVAWDLEKDGKAGMIEMTGKGIGGIKEAMQEKESMMATLGARLLEEAPTVAETATAVNMRHSGEQATLRTIAQVVESGLTQALKWFAWWAGTEKTPGDVEASIELNKDFSSVRMDAEGLKAIVMAWQSEAVSYETLHANLVRGDVMREDVSAEDEKAQIEREGGGNPEPLM